MELKEVEPGLTASLPVQRLSHSEYRCIIAYYLQSPLSADLSKLLYFEFDRAQVDSRRPEPLRGQVVVADPDGSGRGEAGDDRCAQPLLRRTGAVVRKHPSHRYKDLFLADADGSNLRYLAPFVTHPSWHPSESRFLYSNHTERPSCYQRLSTSALPKQRRPGS